MRKSALLSILGQAPAHSGSRARAVAIAASTAVATLGMGIGALGMAGCKGDPKPSGSPGATPSAVATTVPASSPSAAPAVGSPIPAASVAAIVNPSNLPAYAGPTGSVEGTIFITGDPPPPLVGKNFAKCPAAVETHGRLFRAGPPNAEGKRPVAAAIVAVTGYSGYFLPEHDEARRVVVDACEEFPRTIDMTFGQRLEIQNKTKELFAPSVEQVQSAALMIATPGGDPIRIYLPRPAHFSLVDRLGNDAISADVYTLFHPLHAASRPDGHYRIDGIPLGKLTVNARLAAIGQETSQQVEILAGVVQKVDLTLNYSSAKELGPAGSAATRADAGAPRVIH